MTNKEAKEKLYMEWQKFLEDNIDYAGISETYKMAIKALEQESSGDCISREAIKKDLKKCMVIEIRDENDDLVAYYNADAVDSIVRNLPSVKPQEKMGHWIASRCDMYECSECDHIYTDLSGERYGMHYCPNCGAKLSENPTDSEQEDDWDKLDDIEQSEVSRAESEEV